MDRRMCREAAGFTLVELVIVMALVAIITSFAAPAWHGYIARLNLRTAAREISADMTTMRSKASAENTPFRMVFDASAGSYTLEKGDTAGTTYTVQQTKLLSNIGSGMAFSSVDFDSGAVAAVFQTRGTCSYGSVVLKNSNSDTATIAMTLTGRTYVAFQ